LTFLGFGLSIDFFVFFALVTTSFNVLDTKGDIPPIAEVIPPRTGLYIAAGAVKLLA
jgi:hypothetical protein